MAIILPGGFNITNNEPVDSRLSVADASARLGLSSANVYEGLIVYQKDTNEIYALIDASDPSNSSNWSLVSTLTSGSSSANIYVSGSDSEGNNVYALFNTIQFDSSTGLNVSQSASSTAFVSLGSHFRDIFVDGQTTLIATGSDQLEIISGNGINITTSTADTNASGVSKELSFTISNIVATTGSNLFIGDQTVTGNIRATGDIIAERYIVSSSIVNITQSFSSGSTIFGDTLDDTHQFTGSVSITGSFFLNNTDILAEIQSSGIFRQTGSYYSTTNDLKVTGSFQINLDGNQDQFSVDITGSTKFQINEQGVVILGAFEYTPSPVAGGMFYSQSNEFFLGL